MGGDGSTGHKLVIHKPPMALQIQIRYFRMGINKRFKRKGCNWNFKNYFLGELPVEMSSSELQEKYGPKQ